MTIETLEESATTEIALCPLLEIADEIDRSGQRKMLALRHPCYNVNYLGSESDKEGKRKVIVRKLCRGYDTSCPAHPDYIQ